MGVEAVADRLGRRLVDVEDGGDDVCFALGAGLIVAEEERHLKVAQGSVDAILTSSSASSVSVTLSRGKVTRWRPA